MYEVENIVGYRAGKIEGKIIVYSGKAQELFLVKWAGYDSSHNTWEPEKNLSSCKDAIVRFKRKRKYAGIKNYSLEEDEDNEREIKIIELGKRKNEIFVKICKEGKVFWVETLHLLPKYAKELCEFYESYLVYD